jgi:hypothetical protein
MEHELLITTDPPPRVTDAMIAMRVTSFVVFLASACFFGLPILYYGVSQQMSAANCWCVGGILLLSSMLRLWYPIPTIGLSWFNMILGLWVFISPFILGYMDQTGYAANTMILGVVIVGMSLSSIYGNRFPGTPLATASEELVGLKPEGARSIRSELN